MAGYEVVWRETTSPDWTNVIDVGDVTTVTFDMAPQHTASHTRRGAALP